MTLQQILRHFGHQKWIRRGIRKRIIRAFNRFNKSTNQSFTVPFYNKIYAGDFSVYIDWNTYYFGDYCGAELEFMRDALNGVSAPVVLDIGANIGHHSLFASTIAKEVHSFEPFPKVLKKLYEKIEINSITNIKVHEIGLGETNEDLLFAPPPDHNTGSGSFVPSSISQSSCITLPIRIGDEYLTSFNIQKIDFIKMDIEGFEPQALRGLRQTLQKHKPIVFFEWSANERKTKAALNTLFPKDYKIYKFVYNRTLLGIFCKQGYELVADELPFFDGNKVAIPNEKIGRFSKLIK